MGRDEGQPRRNGWGLTDAQIEELIRRGPPPIKPARRPVLMLGVSARTAENARARPDAVRVLTKDEFGVTLVEVPGRGEHYVGVKVDWVRG